MFIVTCESFNCKRRCWQSLFYSIVVLSVATVWRTANNIIAKFVGFLCEFSFSDIDKMLACVHDREQLFRGYCFVWEELIVFSKATSSMHHRQSSIQINSSRIEHRGSSWVSSQSSQGLSICPVKTLLIEYLPGTISSTPDFEQKFWAKKCGLYVGVYGECF